MVAVAPAVQRVECPKSDHLLCVVRDGVIEIRCPGNHCKRTIRVYPDGRAEEVQDR